MDNTQHKTKEAESSSENTGSANSSRADPRRNPRIVIGNLDYFEMLMEQEEQI